MAAGIGRIRGNPPLFVPSSEMHQSVPHRVWSAARWVSVLASFGLAGYSFVQPTQALHLFWALYVPVLPVVFLIVPGIWRNICPMAALNQIPRTLGFTRGLTLPLQVQQYAPLVSAGLFLLIIGGRRVFLDHSSVGLAFFLVTVLTLAFVGGVVFKGKSGWCSQFCPMLQIERFYGQAPLRVVRNDHCRPCVGCTKNCYDFNPTAAYLADLFDENPKLSLNRRLFAGAMPWIIYAFFTQPYLAHVTLEGALSVYGRILLFAGAGVGAFLTFELVTGFSTSKLILLNVVAAINVFYHFVAPIALGIWGVHGTLPASLIQVAVAVLSIAWFVRALPREDRFRNSVYNVSAKVADSVVKAANAASADKVEIRFVSGPTVLATFGEPLLNIAEANGVKMDAGCRMGMCGADPVRILEGSENLSPLMGTERATLERLSVGEGCRMACMAKVQGSVTVVPTPDPSAVPEAVIAAPSGPGFDLNPEVERVIVIGNGIAGTTAATEVRKLNPQARVTLYGHESYDFYNRMAIGKLMSESTAINNLYLLAREWAQTKGIEYFPESRIIGLDSSSHSIEVEDGNRLPFDRLVLATGSRAFVPPLEGFGMAGSFVLRTIDDGVQVQQYVRRNRSKQAMIVGGGLLGLEAAHELTQIGVRVYVLNRGPWPLDRQLDEIAGSLLSQMLSDLGIAVLGRTSASRLIGETKLEGAELTDGTTLKADLCLVTAGIGPEIELARSAGLEVDRGVIVDDHMQTSDSRIYAAGDCASLGGKVFGLWPAAMEQGKIAATNLLGGDLGYVPTVPPARLKVAGIDLLSVGEIDETADDRRQILLNEPHGRSYRKLVLHGDRLVGAILIGYPELFDPVIDAVKANVDVGRQIRELEAGNWRVLENVAELVPA